MSALCLKKKAKETYNLHKLDVTSIYIWIEQNTAWMFYYMEIDIGALNVDNMLFHVIIQTNMDDDVEAWL